MQNSKLISILKTVTREELTDFGHFLDCRIFNSRKRIRVLYKIVDRFYPTFDSPRFTRKIVSHKVFGTNKYSPKRLATLMSLLTHQLEDFLIIRELQSDQNKRTDLLYTIYLDRRLTEHFQKEANDLVQKKEASPERDEHYYLSLFDLNYKLYKNSGANKWNAGLYFKETIKNLDAYYYSLKLKLAIELKMQQKETVDIYPDYMVEEIEDALQKREIFNNPLFKIYLFLIRVAEHKEEADYYRLKELIYEHIDIFSGEEKVNIWIFLINISNYFVKLGKKEFIKEIFEVHLQGIEQNILVKDNHIEDMIFNNFVRISAHFKNPDWSENFIKENAHRLNPEKREIIVNFNMAYIEHKRHNYEEALVYLREVEFIAPHYNYFTRCLMVMCYYDLGDDYNEPLTDYIRSFRIHIKRSKVFTDARRLSLSNFTDFVELLMKNRFGKSLNVEEVLDRLKKEKVVVFRVWLREKIEAFRQ